jgi:hypothetical protein
MNNETTGGRYWPAWGVAAGVLGPIGHMFSQTDVSLEQRRSGAQVVEALDRTGFHVGVVAGFLAVFCLLVFAAGWRRWAAREAPTSFTADIVPLALTASAGAMILGYGIKGMLAIYLPGGINAGEYGAEGLYTLFMFDDLGPYMAWYGVTIAAAAVTWLSLRERVLPIWIGMISLLLTLVPIAMLVVTGLSGLPGVVQPLWLIVISIGLLLTRQPATASEPQPSLVAAQE